MAAIPKIDSQPEVPDGGFGPNEIEIRRASLSNKESNDEGIENEEVCTEIICSSRLEIFCKNSGLKIIESLNLFLLIEFFNLQALFKYGALTDDSSSSGGLIGTIISLIGLNSKKSKLEPDTRSLTKAVGNLIGVRIAQFQPKT